MTTTSKSLDLDSNLNELSLSWCQLDTRACGEELHRIFEVNPMLPGITLVDEGELIGLMPRGTFQKQMALPYGTALYMTRPIVAMDFQTRAQLLLLASSTPISQALQLAMARPPQEYHDPIVVETMPGVYGLLDPQDLMTAQAVIHQKTIQLYKEANERWVQTTERLRVTQEKLVVAAHQAGMTELAAEVLHNVGNALNGMSISTSLLLAQLDKLRVDLLPRMADALEEPDLSSARLAQLAAGLRRLHQQLETQNQRSKDEGHALAHKLDQVIRILKAQEIHVQVESVAERCDLVHLIPDLVAAQHNSFPSLDVQVAYDFQYSLAWVPKSKLFQVLRHLLRNSFEAMAETGGKHELRVLTKLEGSKVCLALEDDGTGILPDHLSRLCTYGFTTKGDGRGFGLHYCANAVHAMAGELRFASPGQGRGSVAKLLLPPYFD